METRTLTKKERIYQRIQRHGEQLNAIFNTGIEPVALCKKLRRLELQAERLAVDYCNGDINSDKWESECNILLLKVNKILGNFHKDYSGIFINGDPRGYALKINDEVVRENALDIYTDLGGYGIIAPDLIND